MSNLRAAAQQALETLEDIFGKNKVDIGAITALRAALAQEEPFFVVTRCQFFGDPPAPHQTWPAFFDHAFKTRTFVDVCISALPRREQGEQEPCTYRCEAWPECVCVDLAKPAQEPVAWIAPNGELRKDRSARKFSEWAWCQEDYQPLYTHPPRREWKGLSENELGELMRDSCGYPMCPNGDDLAFAHAIEQALKERNHG